MQYLHALLEGGAMQRAHGSAERLPKRGTKRTTHGVATNVTSQHTLLKGALVPACAYRRISPAIPDGSASFT
jgi:hypothetical protein